MHIKTNIEHNMIQIIILAVCPLLMVVNNITQAIFFIFATGICFVASSFLCGMFNRYFSRNVKIFVSAVLSSFLIAILDFILKKEPKLGLESNSDCFYAVLSVICLCLDIYCIDSKSVVKLHMIKTGITTGIFAGILIVFGMVVEILGQGSFFGAKMMEGNVFFTSITFKLILLGVIAIVADYVYRTYQEKVNEKKMAYEKYVRKIRDEKYFQYDELRRKKLLTSKIEINNVKEDFIEVINQKTAEHESVEEDISNSLRKTELKKQPIETGKKKDKKSKLRHQVNVKVQEKERNAKPNSSDEKVDKGSKKKKSKDKSSDIKARGGGKARVERVFPSNSNPDDDDKKN